MTERDAEGHCGGANREDDGVALDCVQARSVGRIDVGVRAVEPCRNDPVRL